MRNRCLAALGVALVIGLAIAEAQARPGGGGRRGAGSRARGTGSGTFQSGQRGPGRQLSPQQLRNLGSQLQSRAGNVAGRINRGDFQNKVSQLKTNFTPANQPFTRAWYADHPRAWRYAHPHADVWAVATLAAATRWLGFGGAGTVYTSETTGDEEFLPLGVFALAPTGKEDASALVQLAVDRQGNLHGNYYDVLTGQDQIVTGKIDKSTQRANFKVGFDASVVFETTLATLTQSTGPVALRFENGQTRQWTLARYDDA